MVGIGRCMSVRGVEAFLIGRRANQSLQAYSELARRVWVEWRAKPGIGRHGWKKAVPVRNGDQWGCWRVRWLELRLRDSELGCGIQFSKLCLGRFEISLLSLQSALPKGFQIVELGPVNIAQIRVGKPGINVCNVALALLDSLLMSVYFQLRKVNILLVLFLCFRVLSL